jgi:hypothetical protein
VLLTFVGNFLLSKNYQIDFLFRYPTSSLAVPVIPLPISLDIPVGSFADVTRLLERPLPLFLSAVLSFCFLGLIPQYILPLAFFASFICFSGKEYGVPILSFVTRQLRGFRRTAVERGFDPSVEAVEKKLGSKVKITYWVELPFTEAAHKRTDIFSRIRRCSTSLIWKLAISFARVLDLKEY